MRLLVASETSCVDPDTWLFGESVGEEGVEFVVAMTVRIGMVRVNERTQDVDIAHTVLARRVMAPILMTDVL